MAFSDNFTDTTGTALESHTPSGGTAWTRVDGVAGAAKITSNALQGTTATATAYRCDDQGSSAHYVQGQYLANSSGCHLANRLSDSSNFVGVRVAAGVYAIRKCVAGSFTTLASGGSATLNDIYKLQVDGSDAHTLFVNGVSALGPATDSFNNTQTRQGIVIAQSTTAFVDSFQAGTLGGSAKMPPGLMRSGNVVH